jgi:hypothetical protein
MRLLAISGSLRARATNTELLRAVALVAGDETEVVHSRGLGELPHFDPDLDAEGVAPVRPWGPSATSQRITSAKPHSIQSVSTIMPKTVNNVLTVLSTLLKKASSTGCRAPSSCYPRRRSRWGFTTSRSTSGC